MPQDAASWLGPFAVLIAGLVAGALLVRRLRGTAASAAGEPATLATDRAVRFDQLVQQLRDLEDTAGKRTPEQVARERSALEVEAARVLREMDRASAAAGPPPLATEPATEAPAPSRDRAGLRGFLWGAGSAAAIALLLFLVSRAATERPAGGGVTGEMPEADAPAASEAPDEETAALRAAVARNPDDLDARLELARSALGRQDMMEVFDQTRAVLERSPGHPRALSYQALVRLAMGEPEEAERMLKQALARDPGLLEAHVHLALVYMQGGRLADAEKTIQEAAQRHPEQAGRLRSLMSEMRRVSAGGAAAPAPPGSPAPAAGPTERTIAGSLELDAAARSELPPSAVVFVMLRPEGGGGPPLAARRLPAAAFPLAFEVGSGDSMMGAPLPERVRVEARIDSDGDPMTRSPADAAAAQDGVVLGTRGLRLVLRRP